MLINGIFPYKLTILGILQVETPIYKSRVSGCFGVTDPARKNHMPEHRHWHCQFLLHRKNGNAPPGCSMECQAPCSPGTVGLRSISRQPLALGFWKDPPLFSGPKSIIYDTNPRQPSDGPGLPKKSQIGVEDKRPRGSGVQETSGSQNFPQMAASNLNNRWSNGPIPIIQGS